MIKCINLSVDNRYTLNYLETSCHTREIATHSSKELYLKALIQFFRDAIGAYRKV